MIRIIEGEIRYFEEDPARIRSAFEGIVNKTIYKDDGTAFVQIKHNREIYEVGVVNEQSELEGVKSLDDDAFEGHAEISLKELTDISSAGRVLVLKDNSGFLVAEAQILCSPIPDHPKLDDDEAYCYGTAVRFSKRGKGFAQIMYKAQEVIAREAGKHRMTLTVRPENGTSIRARLKNGFRITDYDDSRYGTIEMGGARFLMEKNFTEKPFPFEPLRQSARVRGDITVVVTEETINQVLADSPIEIAVPVIIGDKVDFSANRTAKRILVDGYVGTGLLKPEEYGTGSENHSLLIFQRKDSDLFVEKLAFPINVASDFGKLKEVVLGHPPEVSAKSGYKNNKVSANNADNYDPLMTKEEFEEFVRVLETNSVKATFSSAFHEEVERLGIFTRDPAFVLGDTIVVGKMKVDNRQYETGAMLKMIDGLKVVKITNKDAILEGGDVVFLGNKTVVVGLGQRTNEAGLQELINAFPEYNFIGVKHKDLHLDVLFTVLGANKVLADPRQLPKEFIEFVKTLGYIVVEVDPSEQISLGCNVLAIDSNKVIAAFHNKSTNQRLREHGVEVIEIDIPNLVKRGGGPRCMTCPAYRE